MKNVVWFIFQYKYKGSRNYQQIIIYIFQFYTTHPIHRYSFVSTVEYITLKYLWNYLLIIYNLMSILKCCTKSLWCIWYIFSMAVYLLSCIFKNLFYNSIKTNVFFCIDSLRQKENYYLVWNKNDTILGIFYNHQNLRILIIIKVINTYNYWLNNNWVHLQH